jgi:hypothetical protein
MEEDEYSKLPREQDIGLGTRMRRAELLTVY